MDGSESDVSAFMDATTSVTSPGGEPSIKLDTISAEDMFATSECTGFLKVCQYWQVGCTKSEVTRLRSGMTAARLDVQVTLEQGHATRG